MYQNGDKLRCMCTECPVTKNGDRMALIVTAITERSVEFLFNWPTVTVDDAGF